jgi:hypothetical protein
MNNEIPEEPRWPALVAVLGIGSLHWFLPETLSAGPGWMLLVIVAALAVPLMFLHRTGRHTWNHRLAMLLLSVVTAALIYALVMLVLSIPARRLDALMLIRGAAVIWIINILLFASWYWRIDMGGPHVRPGRAYHLRSSFLFPQMTLDAEIRHPHWTPHFIDYLFLAFNTSTAFSPTDSPVLSRWAKALMMLQSLVSLVTLAIVAARAVNII